MTVVRGTVTALAVVLLVASGAWAAPVSAAGGSTPDTVTATGGAVDGVPAVTDATLNGTVENTTNTTDTVDDGTTNTTDTASDGTANATDTTTTATVSASVDDGTVNVSVDGGTEDGSIDAVTTVTGSVSDTSLDAELATNGSSLTTSASVDGGDTVAVSADATVDAEGELLATSATTTDAGTSTPTGENESAGAGGADGSGPDSGTENDVPPAAAGVALAGFGAAAVTLLVRRSAAVVALAPDVTATLSRLPSSVGQLRATVRRWLPRVLAAVGYSRYDDSDPLAHETRAELYELIAASPGTYLSELSERADVPTSTIRYHLDVLVREGVVTTANVRGRRRYFPLGADDEALAAALSDDAAAAVIDCLAETGPASVSTIADALDRDVSTVSHHLGRLAEDGLVERERDGRSVYSRLAPEVAAAVGGDDPGRRARRA